MILIFNGQKYKKWQYYYLLIDTQDFNQMQLSFWFINEYNYSSTSYSNQVIKYNHFFTLKLLPSF